ncbi:MAG: hypothetical protein ACP5O7_10780 [Phycisphaerae bacterium]
MHNLQTQSLFAWEALEDSPSLNTLRQLLAVIPDQALLNSLRQARGHGRNEYPVSVLWGFDDGNITGAGRFHSYVGTVRVVHAAFATLLAAAPRRGTKTVGKLGTLHLGKVQKALQDKLHVLCSDSPGDG